MRIAYLECFSGISGDMFLGALVDAGVPPRLLEDTVAALNVGARLEISRVMRSGISATKVDVWVDGEKDLPREEYWAKARMWRGRPRPRTLTTSTSNTTITIEHEHHRSFAILGEFAGRSARATRAFARIPWPRADRDSRDHSARPPSATRQEDCHCHL